VQVSNQEDHNPAGDVELTVKKILENLKNVKATTMDLSYYHNGTPSAKVPTLNNLMGMDKSEQMQDQ
jgi:hypothetical protein